MPLTVGVVNVVLSLSALIYSFAWWGRRRIRMLLPMTLFLLGHALFDLFLRMSGDEWEAMTAFRYSRIISLPIVVFLYLFTREYCEIPIHGHLKKAALFVVPGVTAFAILSFPHVPLAYRSLDFYFDAQGLLISFTDAPLNRINNLYALLMLSLSFYTFVKHTIKQQLDGTYIISVLFAFMTGTMALAIAGIARTARDDINFLLLITAAATFILAIYSVKRGDVTFNISRDYTLQVLSEPYILVNRKGGFLDANAAAVRLFPVLSRLRAGTNLKKIADIPLTVSASDGELDIRILTDGDARYYHVSHTLLKTGNTILGTGIMMFDITVQQELMTAAKRLAQRDLLTGMYNRNAFLRTASQDYAMVLRGKYDASLILCEVENFSSINENFGYAAGDDIVAGVAKTIVGRLRKTDIAARYDNEQFALWLPATPLENAVNVAKSLQKIVSETQISTQHVKLTVRLVFGASYAKIPDRAEKSHKARHSGDTIEIDSFDDTHSETHREDTHEEGMLCLMNLLKEADTSLREGNFI